MKFVWNVITNLIIVIKLKIRVGQNSSFLIFELVRYIHFVYILVHLSTNFLETSNCAVKSVNFGYLFLLSALNRQMLLNKNSKLKARVVWPELGDAYLKTKCIVLFKLLSTSVLKFHNICVYIFFAIAEIWSFTAQNNKLSEWSNQKRLITPRG